VSELTADGAATGANSD